MQKLYTALLTCALTGTLSCMQNQIQNYCPNSHLISAAEAGNLPEVNQALTNGANIDTYDTLHYTALLRAIELPNNTNKREIVKILLKANAAVECTDKNGYTPLHYAVLHDDIVAAFYLLQAGANVDAQSDLEGSAFYLNIWKKDSDIFTDFLLKYNASIRATDEKTLAAIDAICPHVKTQLTVTEQAQNKLFKGSILGDITLCQEALRNLTNLNFKNAFGSTPLIMAAARGHMTIVKLLVKHNANLNITDNCNADCEYYLKKNFFS